MIDPVAFEVLGRPIYWYGVFVALGFLAALVHWNATSPRLGFPPGIGSDLAFIVMIGGILGARALYVVSNFGYFAEHPGEIFRIDQGGLIYYGGFLAATAGVIGLAWKRRIPVWQLGDFAVSALPLGHAFGRFGCLLNGCCYGAPCDLPWAVETAGAHRHPVQGYETLFNLALYVGLRALLNRRLRPGWVVATYLLAYGAWRFSIEFLRGDARMEGWAGLNAAQTLSLALVAVGLGLALWLRTRRPHVDG
jgi:phosphatidylglycerol:prolipoprotein diacylglycerol transferase